MRSFIQGNNGCRLTAFSAKFQPIHDCQSNVRFERGAHQFSKENIQCLRITRPYLSTVPSRKSLILCPTLPTILNGKAILFPLNGVPRGQWVSAQPKAKSPNFWAAKLKPQPRSPSGSHRINSPSNCPKGRIRSRARTFSNQKRMAHKLLSTVRVSLEVSLNWRRD